MPRHFARAALARNRSTPSLLKPSRLTSASASGSRKRRGFGLPGCGRGVTVPHSMKPNPSAASPSMCAAFLSSPAASPTRLGNSSPIAVTGDGAGRGANACTIPKRAATSRLANAMSCAVSGSSVKSSGRKNG